jgi:hypothetical protein
MFTPSRSAPSRSGTARARSLARALTRCVVLAAALCLTVALSARPEVAVAQTSDWTVSASIDKFSAYPRDILNFTIEVTGSGNLKPRIIQEPTFDGFTVTGRSNGTKILNVNGKVVSQHDLLFRISPHQTGALTIGPATIQVGNQTFQTDAVVVEVESRAGTTFSAPTPATPPTLTGPNPTQPGVSVVPSTMTPGGQPLPAPGPGGDFFVEARPIRNNNGELLSEVFVGEPVFVRYDLFRREGLLHGTYQSHEPQFTKFWPYDATDPNSESPFGAGPRQRAGMSYERQLLQAYVLVPLEVGEQVISPIEAQVHHGAGRAAHWIASPEVNIKVKPLPQGAPAGFDSRNVGTIISLQEDEEARLIESPDADLLKMRKGDSVTLSLQLIGLGAVSHMKLAPVPAAQGLHISPPEMTSSRDEVIRMMVRGEKIMKLRAIVLEEGELEVPAVTFSYFDTDEGRYRTLSAGPWRVRSEGESPDFEAIKRQLEAQEATGGIDLGPGLPGLRTLSLRASLDGLAMTAPLYGRPWYWALLGLAPALYVGLWLQGLWRGRAQKGAATRGVKKAAGEARKALRALHDGADPAKTQDLYAKIDQLMQDYLDQRFSLKTRGMTTAELERALTGERKVPAEVVAGLVAVLGEARRVRYARGESKGVEALRGDCDRALACVEQLEAHAGRR